MTKNKLWNKIENVKRLLYTLISTHLEILSTLPKQHSILKTVMNSTRFNIYIEITQYILHCHCFFVIEHHLVCHRYNYTKIRISSVLQLREEKKKKNLIAFLRSFERISTWHGWKERKKERELEADCIEWNNEIEIYNWKILETNNWSWDAKICIKDIDIYTGCLKRIIY